MHHLVKSDGNEDAVVPTDRLDFAVLGDAGEIVANRGVEVEMRVLAVLNIGNDR